jgi:hypothetical protein
VPVPDYVREFAREHRIDVSRLTAQDGKQLSLLDVVNDAEARGDWETAVVALSAQLRWNRGEDSPAPVTHSVTAGSTTVFVDPRMLLGTSVHASSRNPLATAVLDGCRAARSSSPRGTAPTLFASGDTPAFTASGIPPEVVLQVPWQARHAMAAAVSPDEAYAILAECTGPDGEATAAMMFGGHPGNVDYADRVAVWQAQSLTDLALSRAAGTSAAVNAEVERREAAFCNRPMPDDDAAVLDEFARLNLGIR